MGKLINNQGDARPQNPSTQDVPKSANEASAPLTEGKMNGLVNIVEQIHKQ